MAYPWVRPAEPWRFLAMILVGLPRSTAMNPLSDPVPLFGPEMLADPYPLYHQLRAVDPVYWSPKFNAWIVTSFDTVAAGLNDLRLSSDRSALLEEITCSKELVQFFAFIARWMVICFP